MRKFKSFLFYWLPVLVWMVLIFSGSSDAASFQHSSQIIGPLMRWLFPHMSDEAVSLAVTCVRKLAHMTEYGILALLIFRGLRRGKAKYLDWNRSTASLAFALAVLYSATDEFHQAFVPSREASVRDVLFDAAGAGLAIFFLWLFRRRRPKSPSGNELQTT